MPSEKKERLSDRDRELVKRRNDALASFIKNHHRDTDVDRISMAERVGGLKSFVPNETARIQESLDRAGVPEESERKNGQGKASRSIIIFTRE